MPDTAVDELLEVRQSFTDPFIADVLINFIGESSLRGPRIPKFTCLCVDPRDISSYVSEFIDHELVKNDAREGRAFKLTEKGKDYRDRIHKFRFGEGLPSWEYLTLDQAHSVMSRGSEIGFFEIQLHYLASSYGVCRRSLPDSARLTLEEALSLGIQHVFLKMNIGADEKQSKFTIMGLYHQNEQPTSEGFRIKTTSFMNYENVWDGPLDFQRECYKAIDKCRKLVKDMYPEKISFK